MQLQATREMMTSQQRARRAIAITIGRQATREIITSQQRARRAITGTIAIVTVADVDVGVESGAERPITCPLTSKSVTGFGEVWMNVKEGIEVTVAAKKYACNDESWHVFYLTPSSPDVIRSHSEQIHTQSQSILMLYCRCSVWLISYYRRRNLWSILFARKQKNR